MRINPFFELNGETYEIKRTRWLIAEYRRMNEENPVSDADKANAIKAQNLVADVKQFSEKEKEWWEKLCENPTPENKDTYFMFKEMSDNAVQKYNEFVSSNDTLQRTAKHSIDILEKVAIKGLAEQCFCGNEHLAKQTWEMFVDEMEDDNKVAEWLYAMADSLFGEDDEEGDDFLSKKRKAEMAVENNRKNGFRKKR